MEAAAVDIFETRLVRAAAAGGAGDMAALSQLAQAAGVSISQGPNGSVVIVAPQADGSGRPTATLPPGRAASQLYEMISPRLQAARAQAQGKVAEQNAQKDRELAVANTKGYYDLQGKQVDAQSALQKVIMEQQAKGADVKTLFQPDIGRPGVIAINGRPFEVIPGEEVDGMMTETTLKPVGQ
jgi:hypothetical protein